MGTLTSNASSYFLHCHHDALEQHEGESIDVDLRPHPTDNYSATLNYSFDAKVFRYFKHEVLSLRSCKPKPCSIINVSNHVSVHDFFPVSEFCCTDLIEDRADNVNMFLA